MKMKIENTINELKGYLFEYLVGVILARQFLVEDLFLQSLSLQATSSLATYESLLREKDPDLVRALPLLAGQVAEKILASPYLKNKTAEEITLVSKVVGSAQNPSFGEADLAIKSSQGYLPISLKLCKYRAFVNTKNAGAMSFLEKYFSSFSPQKDQERMGHLVEKSFLQMGHELYHMADLEFAGTFDSQWEEAGFSHLPGELPKDMREVVCANYYRVISQVHKILKSYLERDRDLFLKSLFPLCGFGSPHVLQVVCFHGFSGEDRYQPKGIQVLDLAKLKKRLKDLRLAPLKKGLSSFEILLKDANLQIRVKPMNKFTLPGLKVNCSVKFFS